MKLKEEDRQNRPQTRSLSFPHRTIKEKGDYNCFYSVSEEEIASMIEPAKELILRIEELINE